MSLVIGMLGQDIPATFSEGLVLAKVLEVYLKDLAVVFSIVEQEALLAQMLVLTKGDLIRIKRKTICRTY
jgi:hypothetical protein